MGQMFTFECECYTRYKGPFDHFRSKLNAPVSLFIPILLQLFAVLFTYSFRYSKSKPFPVAFINFQWMWENISNCLTVLAF